MEFNEEMIKKYVKNYLIEQKSSKEEIENKINNKNY